MPNNNITSEAWDDDEIRILQEYVDSGVPLDTNRKQQALAAINEHRRGSQKNKADRTLDAVKCKLFRLQRSKQGGSSVLPAFDTEKAISDLEVSSSKIISELKSVNKRHRLLTAREKIRATKSAYVARRKAMLERRKKEDEESKIELEKIAQAEVKYYEELGDMDGRTSLKRSRRQR